MEKQEDFIDTIKNGYTFKGETIKIGAGMLDGEVIPEAEVFIPLSTMNRHGLDCRCHRRWQNKIVPNDRRRIKRRQRSLFVDGY